MNKKKVKYHLLGLVFGIITISSVYTITISGSCSSNVEEDVEKSDDDVMEDKEESEKVVVERNSRLPAETIIPGKEDFTHDAVNNFKKLIFDQQYAKYLLPSEAKLKVGDVFLFNISNLNNLLLGYKIETEPEISETDDENGSARIRCKIRCGEDVKEIDYVYDGFLTNKQKSINESEEIKKVLDSIFESKTNWYINLVLKYEMKDSRAENEYDINNYKDKTVKELLESVQFTDFSDKTVKALLSNASNIEGLNSKLKLSTSADEKDVFYNEIYVVSADGKRSSKINLRFVCFLATVEDLDSDIWETKFWFDIYNHFFNDTQKKLFYAEDVDMENISKITYGSNIQTKIVLKNGKTLWVKIKDVNNKQNETGSLDVTFELKIEEKDKESKILEKMFTVYGFKQRPIFEKVEIKKNNNGTYKLILEGRDLLTKVEDYKIVVAKNKDKTININKVNVITKTKWDEIVKTEIIFSANEINESEFFEIHLSGSDFDKVYKTASLSLSDES